MLDFDDPKANGRMTLLVNSDGASLDIRDNNSGITFLTIELDKDQILAMLSRQAAVPVHYKVIGLSKLGKKLILDKLEFVMPKHDYDNRSKIAYQEAKRLAPKGWEVDNHFSSQGSFFTKDKVPYAKASIRKWE